MIRRIALIVLLWGWCGHALAAGLATNSSEDLLATYKQLRTLQGSDQGGVAENLVFKRDAATFTLVNGKLTLAAPVEGRVVAMVFSGRGTFELDPPDEIGRRQIARYSGGPKLLDAFHQAVFFFTDDSWQQIQSQLKIGPGADAAGASKASPIM